MCKVLEDNVVHNSAISAGDMVPIIPAINQGDESYQRQGDKIRPVKLNIKGLISMDRTYASDNKVLLVRVVCFTPKAAKSAAVATPLNSTWANELLRLNFSGGPEVGPFTGDQTELMFPINRDAFIVHYDKTFRIACSAGADPSLGAVEENPSSYVRWSKTIKLPKTLTYDAGVNFPNNACPQYALGYSYADGTSPDSITTRLVTNTVSRLYYKDA